MSETNRNLRNIDKAGQKDLWQRPMNPSQNSKKAADKDTAPIKHYPKPARKNSGMGLND